MKFELFSHVSWPEDRDATQVVNNLTDEVKHGEDLGFYRAWHAEHHFTRYGIGSSSMVLGTHLAARTTRIRLGTAVLLPTLHHPLRMAEDTATMDLVSGGRLDVGVGRGMDNWGLQSLQGGLEREPSPVPRVHQHHPGTMDYPRLQLRG